MAAGGLDWESSVRGEALCGILVECWTLWNGLDPAAGIVLFSGESPAPGVRYKRHHFNCFQQVGTGLRKLDGTGRQEFP